MLNQLACLLFAATFLFFVPSSFGQEIGQCRVGKDAPAYGFWMWAPKSTIKLYIVKADFESDEIPFLFVAVNNWNAASEMTGSGVRFAYQGEVSTPLYCENCLTIMRGRVFDKTKRHAAHLRAYSALRDQIMTWGTIVIDTELTNREALTNVVAHELGHNFGLVDCYSCKRNSTAMNKLKDMNLTNGMRGPTLCDIEQVRAAYKELALHVKPSPEIEKVVDEGEEPIDDDTPVVLRKPRP